MPRKKILLFGAISLFILFLILNVSMFFYQGSSLKKNIATKKDLNPLNEDTILDKIVINGEKESIKVIKLNSHLGFSIKYESSYFVTSNLSTGALMLTDKNNANNYVKFEHLQEKEYYQEYKELNMKEHVVGNSLINYKFFKGDNLTYLKVTKSVDINSQMYDSINPRMDYIISSLVLTSK